MHFLEKIVDLNSYSSSLGFLGYFSYKGRDVKKGGELAIAALEKNIDEKLKGKITALTSLSLGGPLCSIKDEFEYSNYDFENYLMPLVASDFVSDYGAKEGFRSIEISGKNKDLLKKACYVQLSLGGLEGHLFILFEDEGILIYPHDEAGFGAIQVKEDDSSSPRIFKLIDTNLFEIRLRTGGRSCGANT